MKAKFLTFVLFFFTLCSFAHWQGTVCTKCGKPKSACICNPMPQTPVPKCSICGKAKCPQKGKHTVCPTCKKYDFQCKYNFNHPCKQCGRTSCSTKDKHKVCPTCKKYDFQCEYNLSHPCSQCGKEDCKTKNKHEKCPTCGEYDFKCSYKFNHPCSQCGSKDCKKKDKHEKCTTCGEYDFNCRFNCQHPEYVDLGLSVKWATYNVGATRPEEYGDYFAWGETKPKITYNWENYKWYAGIRDKVNKYCIDSLYGQVDNKNSLDLEDDAAFVNWGTPWRMPTRAEQDELRNNCLWMWTTQNDIMGYKVTSKINGNSIFLPASGYRYDNSPSEVGYCGNYRSSSLSTQMSCYADCIKFNDSSFDWSYSMRFAGHSVRAVCQ